jgi:hypothetical protein
MTRRHLINHDASSGKVLWMITAKALHHAAPVTVTEQIKPTGIREQTLLQCLCETKQETDVILAGCPVTGLAFTTLDVTGVFQPIWEAVRPHLGRRIAGQVIPRAH